MAKLILLLWIALLAPGWAHEGGPVPAETRTTVKQVFGGLQLIYEVDFHRQQASAEWGEIDTDKDGKLSQKEKDSYLNAEEAWFFQPLLVEADGQDLPLPGPSLYSLEGHDKLINLKLVWDLHRTANHWTIEPAGSGNFTGQHQLQLEAPGRPAQVEFSEGKLKFSSASAGTPWKREWKWDNRAGALQGALESKSLWAGLAVAFFLGGLHALTPGHGKTIVGAYLIGSRGTIGQAILLGIVVTITHTFSVILLGLVCLWLFQSYLPPSLIPWVGVVSGLLITALGLSLLTRQVPGFLHHHGPDDHHHDHSHGHSHGHHHHHHHGPKPDEKLSLWGLLSLGITGGMVPCPEALAVLLTALALNKLILGLILLLAFSSGLAAVLVAIGILMVTAARLFEKRYPSTSTISRLSDISYIFLVLMGLLIALRSMWTVLFP